MPSSAADSSAHPFSSIPEAIDATRDGKLVVVVEEKNREHVGYLTAAAEHASPNTINQLITEARGLVCCSMHGSLIDRLDIRLMVPDEQNQSNLGASFTVSVDAAMGVSTGASASDRALTVKTLMDPDSSREDGGVLERRATIEARVELAQLAGLRPASVLCEMLDSNGNTMPLQELVAYAAEHNMTIVTVDALGEFRHNQDDNQTSANVRTSKVTKISKSVIPTAHGLFDITVYRDLNGLEHSIMSMGELTNSTPLTRLHSECLTGDVFGSTRCDCGEQLNTALEAIAIKKHGALLYLRQEGRGIGLGNKIKSYALQDEGLDTVDANVELGFPPDARNYDIAADMLREAGVNSVNLMTNNPAKIDALNRLGIPVVERVPLITPPSTSNAEYLRTKANRMGHQL